MNSLFNIRTIGGWAAIGLSIFQLFVYYLSGFNIFLYFAGIIFILGLIWILVGFWVSRNH